MIKLYDKDTGALVGELPEDRFEFLYDQLEEESSEDTDYYLNQPMLEMLEQAGADADLINVLRKALAGREEMEIRWSEE